MKLVDLDGGSKRIVYENLDGLSLYNLEKALGGNLGPGFEDDKLPSLHLHFGGLIQVADPRVYDESLEVTEVQEIGGNYDNREISEFLEWAMNRSSFKSFHSYGQGVNLLWRLTERENDVFPLRNKLQQCESFHVDLLYPEGNASVEVSYKDPFVAGMRTLNNLTTGGFLRNLRSLMIPAGHIFPPSLLNNIVSGEQANRSLETAVMYLAENFLELEEIGDLNQWPTNMVLAFVATGSRITWPALKKLEVGPILFAVQTEQIWAENELTPTYEGDLRTPFRKWLSQYQTCYDRYDSGGIVDETLNPEARSEHRDMAVVGSLSMRAFPALEELTFTFKSADEVAQFFFAWTAFVFYKKVALFEMDNGTGRPTPKTEFFTQEGAMSFQELPVGPNIRKINIICTKLSDLDYEEEPTYLGVPSSFDLSDAWTNQFNWLRVKERRYPSVFPLQLFPNLQELKSNCGLPHRRFLEFLKGEPYPRLERLEIFVGLHARLTMTFLLHNLAIDVKTFVIRPDMALPSGYLCHVMDRLDLFDERQSAIYRLLHKHCPTFSLPEGQSRAPSLPALFRGQAGSDRQYTGHIEREEVLDPAVFHRVYRPALHEADVDGGSSAHPVVLALPGSTRRELHSGRSLRCQVDAAWLTAVKNNCLANSVELSVPEWLLAVLCCYATQSEDDRSEETHFSYIPFDKNLHHAGDGNSSTEVMADSIRLKTAQVFCHTPRLRSLHVTVGFDERDELGATRAAFLKHSIQALVEAICHLKHQADHDAAYQTRERESDEPWLPENVYHCKLSDDDITDEHGQRACPVAFGELFELVIDVAPGNPCCYRSLREDLLSFDLEGVSGTTLASRLPLEKETSNVRPESVPEAFRGHYEKPEPGTVQSVLRVQLRHGPHQATTLFAWRDAE